MANPEAPRSPDGPSPTNPILTRRRVLGGMAGLAGLATVPSLLAACSPAATTAPSTGTAPSTPPASTGGGASNPPSAVTGSVSLGSNHSDPGEKAGMEAINAAFTAATGIDVKMNTVDHKTFQDQLQNYLGATPDTAYT